MIASILTIALLLSPSGSKDPKVQAFNPNDIEMPLRVRFAVATDDAVVVHYSDGTCKTIADTANASGIALANDDTLYVAGPHALRRINIKTGAVALLTDGWEMIDTPVVSPDGRTVAFAGYTRTAKWSIYTITGRNGNPRYIAHGFMPAWDTDGSALLFENYTDESAQVYRYDPKTRDVRKIKYDEDGSIKNAVSVAVSQDAWQLSFSDKGGLFVRDRMAYQTRRVTDGTHYDSRQTFSPDGMHLYFIRHTRDEHGRRVDPRAMSIDLKSGQIEQLMNGPAHAIAVAPPWQPASFIADSEMGPPLPGQGGGDC